MWNIISQEQNYYTFVTMEQIVDLEQIVNYYVEHNSSGTPMEHIVDLEQIMHINNVEHNCFRNKLLHLFQWNKIFILNKL